MNKFNPGGSLFTSVSRDSLALVIRFLAILSFTVYSNEMVEKILKCPN